MQILITIACESFKYHAQNLFANTVNWPIKELRKLINKFHIQHTTHSENIIYSMRNKISICMHRIELKLCAQNNLIKCSVCILTASERKIQKSNIQKQKQNFLHSTRNGWKIARKIIIWRTDSSLSKRYLNMATVDTKVFCFFCYW